MTKWILIWVVYSVPHMGDPTPIAISSGQAVFANETNCLDAGTLMRNNADVEGTQDVLIWTRCFKK